MKSPARLGIRLTGTGSALPFTCLDNHQLSRAVVTSDDWIRTRTGFCHRHLLQARDSLTEMATEAALRAISMAGLAPKELDLIILSHLHLMIFLIVQVKFNRN